MTTSTKLVLLSISAIVLLSASPVLAVDAPSQANNNGSVAQAILRSMPPKAQIYLTSTKLQSCLAREASIKSRSASLTRMATNMLEKFDSISSRVQDYYSKSGKTIVRYSVLVGEVQAKRDAVNVALDASSTEASGFSCDTNDPKGRINSFQKDMKLVKSALKDYRTSIKNLIVAVRSVTATEVKPSQSPKPSDNEDVKKSPNPKSNNQGRGNN